MTDSCREPTDEELEAVEAAVNDYYTYGSPWSIDQYDVVVIDGYETDDDTYTGRLAVVVDGGANASTYGFTESGEAVLVSDALNERQGIGAM
ncbi:MAG: hypothetical protein ABEI27_14195 [Halobellus sp.]|uniref:hypothetical protein n=1 Tax=Halobellus sp. TaxID=1979212 RepID=UPI0035D440E1